MNQWTDQQLQQAVQDDTRLSIHLDAQHTRLRQTTRVALVFPLPASPKVWWMGAQQGGR